MMKFLQPQKKAKFNFLQDEISDDAKKLIKKMCCPPYKRLIADQVLKETWIKENAPNSSKSVVIPLKKDGFKAQASSNKLRKAVLTYVASRLSEDEIKKINTKN